MLKKKLLRDLKQNFSSFFTVFLMVFLGVLVFSGIHSYMDGMTESADAFYEDYVLPNLWITSEGIDSELLTKIQNTEGVKNAERYLQLITKAEDFENLEFDTIILENNEICKFYVEEGEGFSEEAGYVWLDPYSADKNGINVGDKIKLTYSGYLLELTVKGIVITPDHVCFLKDSSSIVPDYSSFGAAYISIKSLPTAYTPFAYVELREGADEAAVKAELKTYEGIVAVTGREVNESYAEYKSEADEGKTYSVIFTALFLIIAILSVVSTMNRFVKRQRTQIGTMKALGISVPKIMLHYLSYGFGISIVAALMGIVVGRFFIGGIFIDMMKVYFQMPGLDVSVLPIVYVVTGAVIVVITAVTYFSCRKILLEPASRAIRVEVPRVKTQNLKKNDGSNSGLSIGTRWNIRDIKRNFGRTLTGIAGIAGCTILIVGAFGMKSTMEFFIKWQYETLYQFEYRLDLAENITEEQLDILCDEYGRNTSQTVGVEVKNASGEGKTYTLLINDAPHDVRFTDKKAKLIDMEDGLYMSEKMLSLLGLKVGDTANFKIYGRDKEYSLPIHGSFRTPQGQGIAMSRSYAESVGIKYTPDCIYSNRDLSNAGEIQGVSSLIDKQKMRDGMVSMLSMIDMMVVMLISVSVILGVVIIYNLGIMSFSEKQYQYATMKVLGFTSKKIRGIFVEQNIFISLIGIILGVPGGYGLAMVIYLKAIGDQFDMMVYITPLIYVLSAVAVFLFALLVNYILSRKIKTIDMVSCLKMNE